MTSDEIIEKIGQNDAELWHGRVDKEDNFVPTNNEMLLDSMSKPLDLIKQSEDGAKFANEAFKAFEDAKIETLQAQASELDPNN